MTDKQIIIAGGRASGITTLREQLARLNAQYNAEFEQERDRLTMISILFCRNARL